MIDRRTVLRGAAAGLLAPAALELSAEAASAALATFEVAICEQNRNEIQIHSSTGTWTRATARWIWKPSTTDAGWGLLSDVKMRSIPGPGWTALVAATRGNIGLVEIGATRDSYKLLRSFDVRDHLSTATPHAIERIDVNGWVVVADSQGYLHLYTPSPTAINDLSTLAWRRKIAFDGAHGVLWDPTYQELWAIGNGMLRTYGCDTSTLNLVTHATIAVSGLGHDLQPDYSDSTDRRLLATTTQTVYTVNTTINDVNRLHFPQYSDRADGLPDVKSIGRTSAGQALWVKARGDYNGDGNSWSSYTVDFFDSSNNWIAAKSPENYNGKRPGLDRSARAVQGPQLVQSPGLRARGGHGVNRPRREGRSLVDRGRSRINRVKAGRHSTI